jgi:hypothetical protein
MKCSSQLWPIWTALVLSALPSSGQLFLVTGSQTSKVPARYPSVLLEVLPSGKIRSGTEVASSEYGTWLIEISYTDRKLVEFSPSSSTGAPPLIAVVDFDKANVVKSCPVQAVPPEYGPFAEWLGDVRLSGLSWIEEFFAPGQLPKELILAMSTDPAVPCEDSFRTIDAADITSIVTNGRAGVAGVAANEGILFSVDPNGRVINRIPGGGIVYLDVQIPERFRFAGGQGAVILVDNPFMSVVDLGEKSQNGARRLLALRKSDGTWRQLPNLTDGFPGARGFGKYLVIHEARMKGPVQAESAGKAEWRKEASRHGPSIQAAFADSNVVYPGRLHLYDVETEKEYVIDTKQGDSEVLLVEDGLVYYRVTDRLYSAAIQDTGLAQAKLIATDSLIEDAHWAFIKN